MNISQQRVTMKALGFSPFFFFLIAQVLTILQTDFMDVFLQHAT